MMTNATLPALAERLACIGESPSLPTPPPVALDVIQKASQADCEMEDIARIIALDPGLCAQMLRAVNSAMFGLQRPIGSIGRALNFLGLKSVRSLVLSLSLPTMRLQTSTDPRLCDWWKASVAGAIVARELAVKLGRPDPEDDMVSALLCDLGVFVLQQVFPAEYGPVVAHTPDVLAYRQCELEEQHLGLNHADVSAFILGRWRLPDDITQPIRHHHRPAASPAHERAVAERSRLLYLATRAAQLQIAPNSQPALLQEVLTLACDRFGLSEGSFLEFLEPLDRKIGEFSALLQLDVGALGNYSTIVANATVELIQLTLERDGEATRLRQEKTQADQELLRWQRLAHRLRREATRERLTGLFNRSSFDESLRCEFRRGRRRCTMLGLLFLDLDGFKGLNDRYGHPFGDQVLKDVAAALRHEVHGDDVVARWGGDEFCVLMPNTSPEGVRTLANRVWHAVSALLVRYDGQSAQLTASVGAVVCVPRRTQRTATDVLAEADRAMFAAKGIGKNRVHFSSLLEAEDEVFVEEVRRRLFGTFLLAREAVTQQQVQAALRAAPPPPLLAGRLLRRLGWITPRRLRRVLRDQRKNRRTFAESALALRYLTAAQVQVLLALQSEPPEALAAGLVDVEALTEGQARAEVTAFYEALAAGVT
ncbi:MAG TPA: HDOD domain-containing protein [Gemmataceae bacterium]|nr:HDOD domain-containing protein [Gemmataceae bacterium]